jgi:hypothetical protein
MVCKIRVGRGAQMRGKTGKRAGELLNMGGCNFFQALSMPRGWEVLSFSLCAGGKVRGILITFPKGRLM